MSKKIILICSECLSRNYTPYVKENRTYKVEQKKFCKHCNKHTMHIETR